MPLLAQDRIEHIGVVDVGDDDWDAFSRDPAGEPASEGDPDPALDLLLDSLGGAGDELL